MFKTLTTIIATAVVVLFGIQNFDHVPVYIFWGKMVNIRLVFVIAIAGTGGYVLRHFVGLRREEGLRRQFQMSRRNNFRTNDRKRTDEFDEEEL